MFPGPLTLSFEDLLCKFLSKLHAPLVEAVDVPEDTLGEDLVLIQGNQASESSSVQLFENQNAGRPVAGILPPGRQARVVGAKGEGVGLGETLAVRLRSRPTSMKSHATTCVPWCRSWWNECW